MNNFFQKIQGKANWFIIVLVIFYSVGIVGMWTNPLYFTTLSPINLGLTALVLLLFSPLGNPDFRRYAVFVAVAGFAVEIVGVRTGSLFGHYYYGNALGFKAGMVPIIIAFNWMVLTLCSLSIASKLKYSVPVKVVVGALLMVFLDLLIEPLTAQLDYWYWQDNVIPIRNFIGWTVVSVFFHAVAWQLKFEKYNRIALSLLILQYAFFILLHVKNILT
jgi:putative membrane protein